MLWKNTNRAEMIPRLYSAVLILTETMTHRICRQESKCFKFYTLTHETPQHNGEKKLTENSSRFFDDYVSASLGFSNSILTKTTKNFGRHSKSLGCQLPLKALSM